MDWTAPPRLELIAPFRCKLTKTRVPLKRDETRASSIRELRSSHCWEVSDAGLAPEAPNRSEEKSREKVTPWRSMSANGLLTRLVCACEATAISSRAMVTAFRFSITAQEEYRSRRRAGD